MLYQAPRAAARRTVDAPQAVRKTVERFFARLIPAVVVMVVGVVSILRPALGFLPDLRYITHYGQA
jgi:cellobiose-specific phosphotransferase system component IIC